MSDDKSKLETVKISVHKAPNGFDFVYHGYSFLCKEGEYELVNKKDYDKLKAERDAILKEADRLAEALEFYDDEIYHYYGLNQQPEVLQDRGDHAKIALTNYRNFKKGMK